jgi:dTDP-4-amino-4,6-dideoxygalactose transaminase
MKQTEPIQVFKPTFRVDECLSEIRECLEQGWTGLGFKTIAFEDAWRNFADLPNAHFLTSATVGLHLALHVLRQEGGWRDADEVITTPLTFVSSNHVILYERLRPVFADVDQYLCIDPLSVEERITDRTKAVIFVGLGGNTGQFDAVAEICRRRNLRLILDAAHMAGSRLHGKHVGHDCDASVFSFQAVKNLPTADSGMVCFRDARLDRKARELSWLGINKDTYARTTVQGSYKWSYDVPSLGYKYHGNSIMAALGLVGLRYLDADNAYRRQLCEWYTARLQTRADVHIIPTAPDCESSRHLYQVLVPNRDGVVLALADNSIYPGVHYRDNTDYEMYRHGQGTCPVAARASSHLLSLPLHLGLQRSDVDRISMVLCHALDQQCSATGQHVAESGYTP